MARNPKADTNIQLFRGSRTRLGVVKDMLGSDCCGENAIDLAHDKLADRVHFSNGLAHSNPTQANDKWAFPGTGLDFNDREVIDHINRVGVGAQISVLVIPTYAFLNKLSVAVLNSEPGLTFTLKTRNGLVLTPDRSISVSVEAGDGDCEVTRVQGTTAITAPFGALTDDELQHYRFGVYDEGKFSLEAEEIIVEVVTMPTLNDGKVIGDFNFQVAVNYEVVQRAEI